MFVLLYWKQILATCILAICCTLSYFNGKTTGYKNAEDKYTVVIQKYQEDMAAKIDTLETLSTQLVENSKKKDAALAKDMQTILTNTKGKPIVIVKDGECTPANTFSYTIIDLNKRVNQSMKDKN